MINIKNLKSRKVLESDDIPNELIKYDGKKVAKKLRKLVNKIITTLSIPPGVRHRQLCGE